MSTSDKAKAVVAKLREGLQDKSPADLFRKYDNDANGTLTRGELTRACRDLGLKLTFNEVSDLMRFLDPNQDGSFSYVEFSEILLKEDKNDEGSTSSPTLPQINTASVTDSGKKWRWETSTYSCRERLWIGSPSSFRNATFSKAANAHVHNKQDIPKYDALHDSACGWTKTRHFKKHYKKVTKIERSEKQRLQRLRKKNMMVKSTSGTPYQLAGEFSRPCTAPPIPGSKRYIENERQKNRRRQQMQAIELLKELTKIGVNERTPAELFYSLDTNEAGQICRDEFIRGLERMEVRIPSKQISMILSLLDPEEQDSISYQTFEAVLVGNEKLAEDSIVEPKRMTQSLSAPTMALSELSVADQ